jgi:hypothetical protein
VEEGHIFFHLLKFIMNTLPALENNGEVSVRSFKIILAFCICADGFLTSFPKLSCILFTFFLLASLKLPTQYKKSFLKHSTFFFLLSHGLIFSYIHPLVDTGKNLKKFIGYLHAIPFPFSDQAVLLKVTVSRHENLFDVLN